MNYKKIICFAPHPDDETIGMGGTLLKMSKQKCKIDLVNFTRPDSNYPKIDIYLKNLKLIQNKISKVYNLNEIINLKYISTKVDQYPKAELVKNISKILIKGKYDTVFIPFIHDVHTDHQIISKSVLSSVKSFNNKYVKKVMMYETLSETNFNFLTSFTPNHFEDISRFLKKKLDTSKFYKTEIFKHPHPRSLIAIKSLSILRGSQSGYNYAEAFSIVYSKNGF